MKLYTFYSDSHYQLYNDYFLKSLNETNSGKFEVIAKKVEQRSKTGAYDEQGFNATMKDKVELLLDAVNDNWGDWFIFADCDIQFLAPFYDDIISYQQDGLDIVAQPDLGTMCAGFFMGKADVNLKKILEKIHNTIENFHNDQLALNAYNYMVTWKLLDKNKYFTIANVNGGGVWSGDTSLSIPKGILVHHANFTIGVQPKLDLMDFIKTTQ